MIYLAIVCLSASIIVCAFLIGKLQKQIITMSIDIYDINNKLLKKEYTEEFEELKRLLNEIGYDIIKMKTLNQYCIYSIGYEGVIVSGLDEVKLFYKRIKLEQENKEKKETENKKKK